MKRRARFDKPSIAERVGLWFDDKTNADKAHAVRACAKELRLTEAQVYGGLCTARAKAKRKGGQLSEHDQKHPVLNERMLVTLAKMDLDEVERCVKLLRVLRG